MPLLTVKAISELLDVRPSTIYLWAEQGAIPHTTSPRRRRSRSEHVDNLIAQAKRAAYTPLRGKPDQDRATGKEEADGSV
jgi:excisionase family DNA binding protein